MKKLLMMLLAVLMLVPAAMAETKAEKNLRKLREKEIKEKIKEYKKGGWALLGSSRTFEVVLNQHYTKLDELAKKGRERDGQAQKCISKDAGLKLAQHNAHTAYAQDLGAEIKAKFVSDLAQSTKEDDAKFETFYAGAIRNIEQELKNEMEYSYSVYVKNPDGTYDVQSFFIIDEDGAYRARMRALENSMKENEFARQNAQRISDFVNSDF